MILRVGGWAFRICITPVWSFDSILCTNSFKVGTTGGGGGVDISYVILLQFKRLVLCWRCDTSEGVEILAMSFYYSLRD